MDGLVFLKDDKNKLEVSEKYLVVEINASLMCLLRTFTTSQLASKVYTVYTYV